MDDGGLITAGLPPGSAPDFRGRSCPALPRYRSCCFPCHGLHLRRGNQSLVSLPITAGSVVFRDTAGLRQFHESLALAVPGLLMRGLLQLGWAATRGASALLGRSQNENSGAVTPVTVARDEVGSRGSGAKSEVGARDSQLVHAGVQRGAIHAQAFGRASPPSDLSLRFAQHAKDMLPLDFVQCG